MMDPDAHGYHDAAQNGMAAGEQPATFYPDDDAQIDEFMGQDYNEEDEERKHYRRKRLAVLRNLVCASLSSMLTYAVYLGLLQVQLILHYDETYREVKYGNMGLQDIDRKMLMGINITPIVALLYTPVLIRFLGTKWMMFLAMGIYALFVSTNYWERYYTLVPSAIAIGAAIVPLWAAVGNYVTRMAQKYYEYLHYKEEHVQDQGKAPKGACHRYIITFQCIFYFFFNMSFIFAEMPTAFFLDTYLCKANHTLFSVKYCGTDAWGTIEGLNRTVLWKLPQSISLIIMESVLMGVAFLAMLMVLTLCGPAYRPTEEIDLRSIGWGNIFQLPFKHMRDYRLRHLFPLFIYSGFEVLFACTGFALSYGVCSLGMEHLSGLIMTYGASASLSSLLCLWVLRLSRQVSLSAGALLHAVLIIGLFCWAPAPLDLRPANVTALYLVSALWGLGGALNKTGLAAILGMFYEHKERQDFAFCIYHWCQAMAIFVVYLWSAAYMKVKLGILLVTLLAAIASYLWMEQKLARKVPFRIPRIPKPRHQVRGYRYLEEDNSDQSEEEEEGKGDKQSLGAEEDPQLEGDTQDHQQIGAEGDLLGL
ncbi:protein unc-93 homolog B1 isoform X1 [Pristis pectinata]|uniref:protein unc-93 homolog B1 isoform X1 n=1 Tax=Pristis pectinata TaxID=685728 RepID=UPI00223E72B6|nr:protein unc-93 homolog B1 isoform X1 [Pristis pectinata]